MRPNPLIRVCSHVRSGTHFLMSILKSNYYSDIDLSLQVSKFGHWSRPADYSTHFQGGTKPGVCPWGKLFGGHFSAPPKGDDLNNVVYIFRDGKDVVQSMYRFLEFRSPGDAGLTLGDYLRQNLDWLGSPDVPTREGVNPVLHWFQSVQAWLRSSAHFIRYEDLKHDPDSVLAQLEQRFSLVRQNDSVVVPRKTVGLGGGSASRRVSAELSGRDLEFFHSIVPVNFRALVQSNPVKENTPGSASTLDEIQSLWPSLTEEVQKNVLNLVRALAASPVRS